MTARPIPFSPDMVRALLDGTKTQTRRVLKPQPRSAPIREIDGAWNDCGGFEDCGSRGILRVDVRPIRTHVIDDHLWVREAWKTRMAYDDLKPSELGGEEGVCYLADGAEESWGWSSIGTALWGRYRPPMFMPRWASRLTLTVTDVRVQRVQDISEDDAKAEGITCIGEDGWSALIGDGARFYCAMDAFHHLWNSLNDARGYGWDANPWVSATTFTLERRNIDE